MKTSRISRVVQLLTTLQSGQSYGDQVQVLAPKALRNKVLETAKNMIKLNS